MHGGALAGTTKPVRRRTEQQAVEEPAACQPRLHPDVEQVTIGEQTILTRTGRLHLALSPEDHRLLALLEEGRPVPPQTGPQPRHDPALADLLRDLDEAGFLEGSATPTEPRFTCSTSGVEFGGFDRLVATIYRRGGRWFLQPPALALAAVLAAVGGLATLATLRAEDQPPPAGTAVLVAVVVFGWLTTGVHETAHALVIHHGGRRVGRVGLGFYWGALGFYVDATDALFLPRRLRAAQAGAGPIADAVLAALLGLIAWATAPSLLSATLALIALLTWLEVAVNLVPFLKLDGYWVLTDLFGRPDLAERSWQAFIGIVGRRHPGHGYLAAYCVASLAFGALLLVTAVMAWLSTIGPLVAGAWRGGTVRPPRGPRLRRAPGGRWRRHCGPGCRRDSSTPSWHRPCRESE